MNEKTELLLQGLAELGIKDFETLEEVQFRQTDMLDCLASSFVARHVYAGLTDCRVITAGRPCTASRHDGSCLPTTR